MNPSSTESHGAGKTLLVLIVLIILAVVITFVVTAVDKKDGAGKTSMTGISTPSDSTDTASLEVDVAATGNEIDSANY